MTYIDDTTNTALNVCICGKCDLQKLAEMENKHKQSLAAYENSLGSDEESEEIEESLNEPSPVGNGDSHPSQIPMPKTE